MNWDRIEQLLKIAEGTLKWPKLRAIHEAAMGLLEEHAAPKQEPVVDQPPPQKEDE